ncbi:MAG TPA: glutamate--tRNA ligase [Candidatus Acidoferrales bacterium]|nr:glutamate--tRNA ligase [Candidatus Acidoferrales bacterium]
MAAVRVRFAPSPTGYLHVGGARTALFNWLFARQQGGVYVLRIEDTDIDRSRPELVEAVIEGLRWLGLDWDEGPYFQSQRLASYHALADRLLQAGHAYRCFCTPEELDERRQAAEKTGKPWKYDGRCRKLSTEEVAARQGQPHAVRFRVPETGAITFDDVVYGQLSVNYDEIEDFVLLRSDRLPTYHLGVVADDIDMRITHVIRGADHISNTPKQILIYEAVGVEPPVFAHVPLILGSDRTRLSKRHGATSVTAYRDDGFLPEAFRNFLALLGWSPGDDTELMRTEELIRRFSLANVSRTNASFDRAKLEWFNAEYLRSEPLEKILPHVENELRRSGLWQEAWCGADKEWFARVVDLLRPRARLLTDFSTWARSFFSDEFDYDAAAVRKFLKDERLGELLAQLREALAGVQNWTHDEIEKAVRGAAERTDVKAGLLINASRVALTGQAVAPPLFATMEVLGREKVVTRLQRLVDSLPSLQTRA